MSRYIKTAFATLFITVAVIALDTHCFAQSVDTMQKESAKRKTVVKSTARIHNRGLFSYGGRVSSNHPAFDINLIYEREQWGLLCYKALDLKDHTSSNNFALMALYKNFKIGSRLTFTPHVGFFLEQPHSVADEGSDATVIAVTTYKFNKHFSIDHTALLGNLLIETEHLDWVNRVRFQFTSGHIDITVTAWHNNHTFDTNDYASGALTIAYNRLKVSRKLNLNFSVTDIAMIQSSNNESVPRENNLVATMALQFV
jgi:hypothetical protein